MAYFRYLSNLDNDCLFTSFESLLEKAGLNISKEFSSHAQIFAEEPIQAVNYQSKVKVIISWTNKSIRECSIEVRSDEPYLQKNTSCEKLAIQLQNLIPPKPSSNQSDKTIT